MSLSIHCAFSETFCFVATFNLRFAVTKTRKSTWVLHPLYKSSLWNLKWPVWPLLPLCLHISLLAFLFLRKTSNWWAGLTHQEANPAGHSGKGAQPCLYLHPWVLLFDKPKAWLRHLVVGKAGESCACICSRSPGWLGWAGTGVLGLELPSCVQERRV